MMTDMQKVLKAVWNFDCWELPYCTICFFDLLFLLVFIFLVPCTLCSLSSIFLGQYRIIYLTFSVSSFDALPVFSFQGETLIQCFMFKISRRFRLAVS